MVSEGIETQVHKLCTYGDYQTAADIIRRIANPDEQFDLCYNALIGDAMTRAIAEHGEVTVFDDRNKYEAAKAGMGNVPPHVILFRDKNDNMEGIEEMLDFVPEDNPIKQLYRELDSE